MDFCTFEYGYTTFPAIVKKKNQIPRQAKLPKKVEENYSLFPKSLTARQWRVGTSWKFKHCVAWGERQCTCSRGQDWGVVET